MVKPYDHYGINPTREALFIESVYALPPKQQYYALNDLTCKEYESKYAYPDESIREHLRQQLHNVISVTSIGIHFSQICEKAFREDWVTCHTRVSGKAFASAITAARTMLETLLKSIITERGENPDGSGDLIRLLRASNKMGGTGGLSTSAPRLG